MTRKYSDRNMAAGVRDGVQVNVQDQAFFFPKHVPPVTIRAKSREEAEEKLAALDNNNE